VLQGRVGQRITVDNELDTKRSHLLTCEECGCESDDRAPGREGHLAIEDDGTESVTFSCSECVDELSRDPYRQARIAGSGSPC